ncbi:MAG: aspartyl protease family protein, partial [Ginsengibacter sp.]
HIMRNLLLIPAITFLLVQCKNIQAKHTPPAIDNRLHTLLDQKDFFRLAARLNQWKDSIDDDERLYFQSFVDNAFNRNELSVARVDSLLQNYSSKFSDSAKAALQLLQGDSYFKLFNYLKAAEADSFVLRDYGKSLDSEKVSDIKNDLLIRNALQHTPPQFVSVTENTTIPWTRDAIGIIEIPVKYNTATYSCIFDTRANISSITQTYAKKLGIKMLDVSYEEGSGITGIKFKTGLGIADSLYIGDILLRNVVFQVMPDSILYLAPVHFSLNVIIGFPVISQLREIHIFKNGSMVIPLHQTASELHNFALDGLDPVISLLTGNDTLSFNLDLGASTSDFYYAFFEKNKSRIMKEGHLKTLQYGGAGGLQKKQVYMVPDIELYLGNKKVVLDSATVLMQKIFPTEKMYGNIGNDFTSQFNELVLNFDYMYIEGN